MDRREVDSSGSG